MTLAVAEIPVGTRLVDTVAALGPSQLAALRAAGVGGVIAYLGGNLNPLLLAAARAAGLGVVPVNFSRAAGWIPSADEGVLDSARSAANLRSLGAPTKGLSDWCDLEGCAADPSAYGRAWADLANSDGSGRIPSLYVGAGALLTGRQLYLLPFRGYWHSMSSAIPEPDCGFQMVQVFPTVSAAGVAVDFNISQHDFRSRAPTWWIEIP